MRCKACDTLMTEDELKKLDKLTGDYTELCGTCEDASNEALYVVDDEEDVIYLDMEQL
jgi:hypothetical protein